MTQHPLQFDPNRKENQIDSLSDTWSQADTLLEELPRARQRKEAIRADDEVQNSEDRGESDSHSSSSSNAPVRDAGENSTRTSGRSRQGLLRK